MALLHYEIDEHVAVLTMNSADNRFNTPFLEAFAQVLDEIEEKTDATTLVTRSSHEKVWSNGIDLDWLGATVEKEGPEIRGRFMTDLFSLMKRVLTYPMLTVAAITGHAFAGGAFLSFAHDFRFMRSDRGWLCLPEVDLGMTLGPVFSVLSRRALPTYLFEEMQYTGVRLTAEQCVEHRIVREACHIDELVDEALAFAKTLNKDRELIRRMKIETHQSAVAVIDESIAKLA